MRVNFTKNFKKSYKTRIQPHQNLDKRFEGRFKLFVRNKSFEVLKDHPLGGKLKGFRAFSITGDIRVVYCIHENTFYFVDIGTHNQVYGR